MSEDTANPVVDPVEKQEVSPEAELTTPAPDSQDVADEIVDLPSERKTIPKERFDQVWARSKHAEERVDQLREELQREREERIRLEERTKAHQETQAQKEYTWEQLEDGIAQGTITRAWANNYREGLVREKAKKEALEEFNKHFQQHQQTGSVDSELNRYKQANPEIMRPGSETRQKVEREYQYMVSMGSPATRATELAATRAALGAIEMVEKAAKPKPVNTETFVETHTPSKKTAAAKSFEETLSADMKDHYRKLMKGGAIKMEDWKTVEVIEKRRKAAAR